MARNKIGSRETGCEIFAALLKKDMSRKELVETTGTNIKTLESWLSELRRSGVVYRRRAKKEEVGNVIYVIQPTPFFYSDNRVYGEKS